jgi:hypothetical protein
VRPCRIGGAGCGAMLSAQSVGAHHAKSFYISGSTSRLGSWNSARQPEGGLAPVIADLRAAGITSKKGIAKALNKRAVRTPRGVGEWRAIQVARVLARLPA